LQADYLQRGGGFRLKAKQSANIETSCLALGGIAAASSFGKRRKTHRREGVAWIQRPDAR
jgi:hypothetical protein